MKSYLIIENISDEPLFMINQDENKITKLVEIDGEIEVDHLIVKFNKTRRNLVKNNNEYSFFFEREHLIDFEII